MSLIDPTCGHPWPYHEPLHNEVACPCTIRYGDHVHDPNSGPASSECWGPSIKETPVNEQPYPVAYNNVTEDDWVETVQPRPTTTVKCGIQFCPASQTYGVMSAPSVWFCIGHRWPNGEGDLPITVITDATSGDSAFVDGVEYIVSFQHNRNIKARVRGVFSALRSGDTRLWFDIGPGEWYEVDPDHISDVVAP